MLPLWSAVEERIGGCGNKTGSIHMAHERMRYLAKFVHLWKLKSDARFAGLAFAHGKKGAKV
jgi:hypothetical protein